jgi:PAS domain S-box-containing protein
MSTSQINKKRILAVDDEPQILELLRKTLTMDQEISEADDEYNELANNLFGDGAPKNEAMQFEITLCHQGAEAVKAVHEAMRENNPYAVAFVDVRMPPGPDGVWAAQRIREIDPHIEIVIATGYADKPPHEISCWVPPADKLLYLQKPFHPHEIQQMAVALTSKWHAEKQVRELQTDLERQVKQRTTELIQVNEALRRDMAKRRQVEANLRNERQRLSTVLDSIPIPTFMIDHDHKAVFWNCALESLSKISREQIIGKALCEVLSPVYQGNPPPILADLILDMTEEELLGRHGDKIRKSGSGEAFEVTIKIWPEGEKRVLNCVATPIRDHKGEVIGAIQCAQDITDKEQLQRQLQHAQKMEAVGTLAGGIAHDFSNLLQAIQSSVELLQMGKTDDEPAYTQLQEILNAAARGSELTKQLLIFSRKVESNKRPVCLNNEVLQIKTILERTIPKMIEIELQLADNLMNCNADLVQLEQMIINLAVNAKDAMPDGGKLCIKTENRKLDETDCSIQPEALPGKYVLLQVSDNGYGMDKKTQICIFDPFFTTKGIGQGTGLGLAMVYGLVKSHGGHISCHSELGKGTTFNIYLPATEQGPKPIKKMESEKIRGGAETILLAEDEGLIRNSCSQLLTRFGYTVLTAPDGEGALELYHKQRNRIDLVILDLIMPGMGGKKSLSEILKINPDARVLITSGNSDNPFLERIAESGAKGFIEKPYKIERMLNAMREVLDGVGADQIRE